LICRKRSPGPSRFICTSAAWGNCCGDWSFAAYRCARGIRRPTLRRKRRIKNFAEQVAAVIPAHARGRPIELWWQDEARVGQQGSLTYIWAEGGSRPPAPRDQRYDWAYLFGAICPERETGVGLVLGSHR
jgi:hypothetical protein